MSDILIKGMEMPKSCDNCWALDDYGDYPRCRITEEQRGYTFPIRQKRMDNCPLVPVPPHGDLIDRREAIIDANERAYDFWFSDDEVNATIQFLNEQTTIIPAEEGNSNVE